MLKKKKFTKEVEASEKAIQKLPLDSGMWKVEGVPGLYVRCRKQSKSYWLQRKVRGELIKKVLGELAFRDAKYEAEKVYLGLRTSPRRDGHGYTFAQAFEAYKFAKARKERTVENYDYEYAIWLSDFHDRSMRDIGQDREAIRDLQKFMRAQHGIAASNRALRLLRAVYNWRRRVDPSLPENPLIAVTLDTIEPAQSGYSLDELKLWAAKVLKKQEPKRTFYITTLLTGAREASVRLLQWPDVSFEYGIIRLRNTKRKQYAIPAAALLMKVLTRYREEHALPDSPWVFPSPRKPGEPLGKVHEHKQLEMSGPNALRHTHKTLGVGVITSEESELLLGHGARGGVNRDYITLGAVVEPLRPAAEKMGALFESIVPELFQ